LLRSRGPKMLTKRRREGGKKHGNKRYILVPPLGKGPPEFR